VISLICDGGGGGGGDDYGVLCFYSSDRLAFDRPTDGGGHVGEMAYLEK